MLWVITNKLLLVAFLSGNIFAQQAAWEQEAPGIWKTTVGQAQDLTLLKAAEIIPNTTAPEKLSEVDFPLDQSKIKTELVNGQTYLRFPLKRGEELYGLGLNFKTHNQRGRIMTLHIDHYGGRDNGRTHAPVRP